MRRAAALIGVLGWCGARLSHAQVSVTDVGTVGGFNGVVNYLQFVATDDIPVTSSQANYSQGFSISGDGSTLVGAAGTNSGFAHAFAWTSSGGMHDLGSLGGPGAVSAALAASSNGGVIVGTSLTGGGLLHGFAWSAGNGMVDLGALGGAAGTSSATGVSGDGSVIAGISQPVGSKRTAFVWTAANGMVSLGTIGNATGPSGANGVSLDGSTVVGWSYVPGNQQAHAFAWSTASGMIDLGTLGGTASGVGSFARAADADGKVVVGFTTVPGATNVTGATQLIHAFRWTAGSGMVDLGTLAGSTGTSAAAAVSADGSIIVGESNLASDPNVGHAVLWTSATGIQDLNTLLRSGGVNTSGITLVAARGISSNGQFVVGDGMFPGTGSSPHAFIARLAGGSTGGVPGLTTPESVIASIVALASSRTSQMINNQLLASVLLGVNEQLSCGDCGGAYASVGSFTIGTHGRRELTDELTVLGGFSYGEYHEHGANVTNAWTVAGSLRFDPAGYGKSRPFVETGLTYSPSEDVRYTRTYANGSGTGSGSGDTKSTNGAAYARAGWIDRVTRIDELGVFLQFTHEWQSVQAYSEPVTAGNPFNAGMGSGTDTQEIVGLGGQYTHLFGKSIEGNLNAVVAHAFGAHSAIDATVAGFGNVQSSAIHPTWTTVGGRVGYRAGKRLVLDLFANAVLGPAQIGSSVHGGVDFNVRF
jgi:probable HAF family extracellular repeat protein